MLRATTLWARRKTPWRELLHPLPVRARQSLWMKRDRVEVNEAILRRPYYTLRSVSSADSTGDPHRASLSFAEAIGPSEFEQAISPLPPKSTESWEAFPPHQPSRR